MARESAFTFSNVKETSSSSSAARGSGASSESVWTGRTSNAAAASTQASATAQRRKRRPDDRGNAASSGGCSVPPRPRSIFGSTGASADAGAPVATASRTESPTATLSPGLRHRESGPS